MLKSEKDCFEKLLKSEQVLSLIYYCGLISFCSLIYYWTTVNFQVLKIYLDDVRCHHWRNLGGSI